MVALFHISIFLTLNLPFSLGKQIVCQATFTLPELPSLPFHNKDLNKEVIFYVNSLRKNKN